MQHSSRVLQKVLCHHLTNMILKNISNVKIKRTFTAVIWSYIFLPQKCFDTEVLIKTKVWSYASIRHMPTYNITMQTFICIFKIDLYR